MEFIVQKLHPALRPDQRLEVANTRKVLHSAQGQWDSGCTLHCLAMAGALLGRLPDTRLVSWRRRGAGAAFWDRVWPFYLSGATMDELAELVFELGWGLRPKVVEGTHRKVVAFCEEQLQGGHLVILSWRPARSTHLHAVLAIGFEGRQSGRAFRPSTLLLLDPAEYEPWLASSNARLTYRTETSGKYAMHGTYVTAYSRQSIVVTGALSIQVPRDKRAARKATAAAVV
ncbi:hypothetical protein [Paraburkholderia sp. SOS3]|uniref:hypothetical protein n=1 Tax=Paraburkholderia sp. SOS3 TaxID=1926494 RepID=UPI00094764B9|nr:hypothetical protein [Paraburkholderia sp. SOS3]APR37749.1 hypothetical protein BTO02_16135 [Paraburkholderia sp. SOS3]